MYDFFWNAPFIGRGSRFYQTIHELKLQAQIEPFMLRYGESSQETLRYSRSLRADKLIPPKTHSYMKQTAAKLRDSSVAHADDTNAKNITEHKRKVK